MLNDPVTGIRGIGESRARAFAGLGVRTVRDLLSFFPKRYEDRSTCVPVALTGNGQEVCISAVVAEEPRLTHIRKGMDLVRFKVVDDTGTVDITYFNQSWMKNSLHRGEEYVFYGKMQLDGHRRSLSNPVYDFPHNRNGVVGRIMPVYRLCRGLSQKTVLQSIRLALDSCADQLPDLIPEDVLRRQQLCRIRYAYENIHFPDDFKALELARQRLIFEELFVLSCALGTMHRERSVSSDKVFRRPDLEDFLSSLPFSPTGAQVRTMDEALRDLSSGRKMNRLVQGDVGSGKTLVAAALIWAAAQNGYTSAFMAPTELLAEQHAVTMERFLSPFGIPVVKLTGSVKGAERIKALQQLQRDLPCLAVGTHALFSGDVHYRKLGLVITDEQHRFGVGQRSALIEKSREPHVLVMSATPIPRTLALMIYGDLDVSVIDEMPPGRQKVDTFTVDSSYRERLIGFLRKQVSDGHQVFVVCPKVDEPEDDSPDAVLNLKSAEVHARELQTRLPELRIGCVHGKMKPKEKDTLMAEFSRGVLDVLVSTTVIEVGVDVPNATLMIVENSERFGLSQLHQLRGRVGRGESKSWCILVSDAKGEEAKARLNILCKTGDGFKIAEEDLRLRGPGDFFGSRQHGLPEMHLADLGADTAMLLKAQEEAKMLIRSDPELRSPEHALLKERVEQLFSDATIFN